MQAAIKWTQYLACAYIEQFCEGEDATGWEQLQALAYLIQTGAVWKLQGFYGRMAARAIDDGLITESGDITDYGINAYYEGN